MRVDVLDRDRRLVDQDADRQRQPAERHQVDRLPGDPEREQRGEQRERDVEHDDERAPPVAQEQQHHQPGEDRAERRLPCVSPRIARVTYRRLVELVAHLHVRRQRRPETSARFSLTSSTTVSVEASARLVTGM